MKLQAKVFMVFSMLLMLLTPVVKAAENSIILQSTTSTANSGLYTFILPAFTADTGIVVNVVAVGTGQALKNAKNGDGDVLLVHAKDDELKFVADGFGVQRFDVMYNDFVIVGPASDPARLAEVGDVSDALTTIASKRQLFVSRGDNSGTHKKEKQLWKIAAFDPQIASGTWYRETGSGMGATLNMAVGMGAYTLTDRATWIAFKNKQNFKIYIEGDASLFNQYGITRINPEKHPYVNSEAGQAFIDWILSEQGQTKIASYRLNGEQLFFPNASPP